MTLFLFSCISRSPWWTGTTFFLHYFLFDAHCRAWQSFCVACGISNHVNFDGKRMDSYKVGELKFS